MRSRLLVAALMTVTGCGRVGFEDLADRIDAATTADAPPGQHPDAPLGPFGPAALVTALSDPAFDDDPTLTADLREIYFASNRAGGLDTNGDIWMAQRSAADQAWSAPVFVAALSSAVEDQSPGISADGLTIYFTSRRGGGDSDFYRATRPDRATAWSVPEVVTELSTGLDEFEPQPDATDHRLVLYRQLNDGNRDLFETTRTDAVAVWAAPVAIDSVNTTAEERSPALADGGLAILFGSDRAGALGLHDLFIAHRPALGEPFAAAAPLADADLNTTADEDDPWLSPDGRTLYFSSDRSGDSEIYEATR